MNRRGFLGALAVSPLTRDVQEPDAEAIFSKKTDDENYGAYEESWDKNVKTGRWYHFVVIIHVEGFRFYIDGERFRGGALEYYRARTELINN